MGSHKSVVGAVLLALFFGPLGMLYATVVGALVMFVVNIFVAILTLGLGLFVTIPLGALWAGIAASNHNNRLGAMSTQAVAAPAAPPSAVAAPAVPAGWHDDPDGSGRLRYWDGGRWTEHFADRPAGGAGERSAGALEQAPVTSTDTLPLRPAEAVTEALPASAGPGADEAPTAVAETEAGKAFCGSCGQQIGAGDRFCPVCGQSQDEIV
jgi:hypothetical protein